MSPGAARETTTRGTLSIALALSARASARKSRAAGVRPRLGRVREHSTKRPRTLLDARHCCEVRGPQCGEPGPRRETQRRRVPTSVHTRARRRREQGRETSIRSGDVFFFAGDQAGQAERGPEPTPDDTVLRRKLSSPSARSSTAPLKGLLLLVEKRRTRASTKGARAHARTHDAVRRIAREAREARILRRASPSPEGREPLERGRRRRWTERCRRASRSRSPRRARACPAPCASTARSTRASPAP